MNQIFTPMIQRFVIVFFNDILIYSRSLADHLKHLEEVLSTLRDHSFFMRESKCQFGLHELAYLGQTISTKGIQPYPDKIRAVLDWPEPTTVKQVYGFLGLTGYYRKFIGRYAEIASPLTDLLRKDAFRWMMDATVAF